jgi:enoyl-CoA hydratase
MSISSKVDSMPQVIVELKGPIMLLTLNRPKRMNAFTGTMLAIIADSCAQAAANDDIRCIVLTGAGGNFSSGADLRQMSGDSTDEDAIDLTQRRIDDPTFVERGFLKIGRPLKPIIAAVEGVAVAGGTEIMMGADIRVAGRSARFGLAEPRWSLYPTMGSAVRLPRQVSYTKAAEILLTGRQVSADEAERMGLIGHVVDDGQALTKALEIAEQICDNGPIAVEAILETLRGSSGLSDEEGFASEVERNRRVFASEDAKEGPLAFVQKRKPIFRRR